MDKKVPMRMCVGCREMKPKAELIRVVRTPQGELLVDRRGKVSGRGAYLCNDMKCLLKAVKSKAIDRALEVKMTDELIEALSGSIADTHE